MISRKAEGTPEDVWRRSEVEKSDGNQIDGRAVAARKNLVCAQTKTKYSLDR